MEEKNFLINNWKVEMKSCTRDETWSLFVGEWKLYKENFDYKLRELFNNWVPLIKDQSI
jgi:hypothetical protein